MMPEELKAPSNAIKLDFDIKLTGNGLSKLVPLYTSDNHDNILRLNFKNIDGIPLFRSVGTQFWPILCSVGNITPFIVALFYGPSKPTF